MDIFDYALNMEKEGEQFYRHLSESVTYHRLRLILGHLADDETRHCRIIQKMKDRSDLSSEHLDVSPDFRKAGTVLDGMKHEIASALPGNLQGVIDAKETELKLYHKILNFELKSAGFYKEKLETAQDPSEKNILAILAREEDNHVRFINRLIQQLELARQYISENNG